MFCNFARFNVNCLKEQKKLNEVQTYDKYGFKLELLHLCDSCFKESQESEQQIILMTKENEMDNKNYSHSSMLDLAEKMESEKTETKPTRIQICIGCKKEKTIDLFFKNPTSKSGYENKCKECRKVQMQQTQKAKKKNTDIKEATFSKNDKTNEVAIPPTKTNEVVSKQMFLDLQQELKAISKYVKDMENRITSSQNILSKHFNSHIETMTDNQKRNISTFEQISHDIHELDGEVKEMGGLMNNFLEGLEPLKYKFEQITAIVKTNDKTLTKFDFNADSLYGLSVDQLTAIRNDLKATVSLTKEILELKQEYDLVFTNSTQPKITRDNFREHFPTFDKYMSWLKTLLGEAKFNDYKNNPLCEPNFNYAWSHKLIDIDEITDCLEDVPPF